jgi:1,6-anhydro-N-acetylmuramate kinase
MLRPNAGEKWRIAINIGGTSSVTFCPPWADKANDVHLPIGLDPGLGVFFIDLATKKINPDLEYDANGDMARSGTIH